MSLSLPAQLAIDALLVTFKQRSSLWYWRLFFPSRLALNLIQYDRACAPKAKSQAAVNVYLSYFNCWFFYTWFFQALKVFSTSMIIMPTLKLLKNENLLTAEHCYRFLTSPAPIYISEALSIMQKEKLLTGKVGKRNCTLLLECKEPLGILILLKHLKETPMLIGKNGQENLRKLLIHPDPFGLSYVFEVIKNTSFLTGKESQENFNAILANPSPYGLMSVLNFVKNTPILEGKHAKTNFIKLLRHKSPALVSLHLQAIYPNFALMGSSCQEIYQEVLTVGLSSTSTRPMLGSSSSSSSASALQFELPLIVPETKENHHDTHRFFPPSTEGEFAIAEAEIEDGPLAPPSLIPA